MKRRFVIMLCVVAGIAGFVAAYNPVVTTILHSDHHALLSGRTLLLTLENRQTAQPKTFPVNYLREEEMVYIGSDFGWEKHLQDGAEVRLLIQGKEYVGWALPILDDPERSAAGLRKLRPRTYKLAEWIGSVFVEVQMQDQQD
ncbi:MAG: hypothetical protein J4F42_04950 [Desulfurellaceae bacterium]|nr:hypothetical protein [Desulfurellaceae bacterium]